jgi:hypothetical protein
MRLSKHQTGTIRKEKLDILCLNTKYTEQRKNIESHEREVPNHI